MFFFFFFDVSRNNARQQHTKNALHDPRNNNME